MNETETLGLTNKSGFVDQGPQTQDVAQSAPSTDQDKYSPSQCLSVREKTYRNGKVIVFVRFIFSSFLTPHALSHHQFSVISLLATLHSSTCRFL